MTESQFSSFGTCNSLFPLDVHGRTCESLLRACCRQLPKAISVPHIKDGVPGLSQGETSVILTFPLRVPPKPCITWLHTWARWLQWSTYQLTPRVLKQNFKSVDLDQTFRSLPALEIVSLGNSLVVQWLGLHTSHWWGPGFNPGRGTKIPQDVWRGKKNKKTRNHQPR